MTPLEGEYFDNVYEVGCTLLSVLSSSTSGLLYWCRVFIVKFFAMRLNKDLCTRLHICIFAPSHWSFSCTHTYRQIKRADRWWRHAGVNKAKVLPADRRFMVLFKHADIKESNRSLLWLTGWLPTLLSFGGTYYCPWGWTFYSYWMKSVVIYYMYIFIYQELAK